MKIIEFADESTTVQFKGNVTVDQKWTLKG